MPRGEGSPRRASGFTYLGLLALVAGIGLLLAAAGDVASTTERREREEQLLWVGHEYRAAIGRYWIRNRRYPQALEELMGTGADGPLPVRFIRRLYPDPMTSGAPWMLVPAPGGGIMGVASSSTRAPLKTANFDPADPGFEKATTYGDWQFSFVQGAVRRRAP
jgi:type II secretory pathway pseudopilin PulG